DGRFSGGTRGAAIGHVSPEAVEGGTIALVREGDFIHIDIFKGALNLEVSPSELDKRRKKLKPVKKEIKSSFLKRYSRNAGSAASGATCKT
ncbi:MAG: dihydroxy-acid dehydratase, partial [Desulfonatronovibrio sp.]